MLGTFQQSNIRIEVEASEVDIRHSLLRPTEFQRWLAPQTFSAGLPDQLASGVVYTSWLGPIAIQHQVDLAEPNGLRLLLSQGIDGYHEWYWGDGWIQSCLAGISILPLSLGQTLSLVRLQQFLKSK